MNSPTSGMNLGQRIQHVGGRINAAGYVEFGSEMAVDALIRHVLRDVTFPNPESFQARYRLPGGTWSSWGHVICGVKGHEMQLRCVYSPNCYPQSELMDNNGNGAVPEWWKPMPVNGSYELARAFREAETAALLSGHDHIDAFHCGYRALIAAAPAPDHFRDAAKMAPVHCTPTEHDGRIVYEHTSEPIPNADGFVLYAAPAPDRFRAAAKMMAVQPACMTCSGHGMVGGLLPNGGGYQADPCPDCAAPVTAGVPMPKPVAYGFGNTAITGHTNRLMMVRIDIPGGDQYAGAFWLPLVLADEARQYGAACRAAGEAAGYARGLAEAGRDTAPVVQNGEVLVTVTGLTGSGKSAIAGEIEIMCRALGLDAEWVDGAAEKHLTHAGWTEALEMYRPRVRIVEANIPRTDAALRGEVKK